MIVIHKNHHSFTKYTYTNLNNTLYIIGFQAYKLFIKGVYIHSYTFILLNLLFKIIWLLALNILFYIYTSLQIFTIISIITFVTTQN